MKRLLILGVLFFSVCTFGANGQDRLKIEQWLQEAQGLPQDSCRTLHFAKQMLGYPYVAGTLDGNDEEKLVVSVGEVD